MQIVQLIREGERRVALVEGPQLRLLSFASAYDLARQSIHERKSIIALVEQSVTTETVDYEAAWNGSTAWRFLPSFDHPSDPAHCMVSGTGLTHKASAANRSAMHQKSSEMTDSARMYQMGLDGGSPPAGQIGVQPEWFYKGQGTILRGHNEVLEVPPYAWDGGEEPEIAGVYVISRDGEPYRVGLTVANEFSDHKMEKKNYLYLAPSKLRQCAIGPELHIGAVDFADVPGKVAVFRNEAPLWQKDIWTGQKNMSYSVANLEHHHFKYESHRQPGDVHIHFFGADAFSFGDGIELVDGDVMEVSFPLFGRPLRNPIQILDKPEALTQIKTLQARTWTS